MGGVAGDSQVLAGEEPSVPNLTCCPCPFGQIILALGNYMNSSKRGAVYGFKLQSLDLVRWWQLLGPGSPWQQLHS